MRPITIVHAIAASAIGASVAIAQSARPPLDSATVAGIRWRTIGPANFEGRTSDIAAIPGSKTFFVAAAAGGIWKTTNGGVTFRPVFDDYPVVSMGMLAIAPSDTMQVWAGTGEPNSRNTIEPGQGVYKSTDGGLTWKLMGLEKTQHIGRIAVHPTNPNIVYVAALGAAWKANPERGLYKTEDGGQTWKLVKFISDKAGIVDVGLDPKDPNVVWAASYERVRGPYFLKSGGPGSALWKSTDAGATWTEIKGGGWPETPKGRISFDIFRGNGDVVYAMVEADSIRGQKPVPGAKRQKLANGLYRTKDGGKTWEKTHDANTRPFYYSQVRVDPKNSERVFFSSTPVLVSNDGGKTARSATQGIHVDHHAMWIDPNDPDHIIVGNDGGIAITWDGGGNYDFAAILPIAQFYSVSYDFETPYNICTGAQDNGSWCGPSKRKDGPVTNAYWFTYAGGDGFWAAQHPIDSHIIWGESQGGNISRVNTRTGERTALVKPNWRPRYAMYEDSVLVTRPDTATPATRDQQTRIAAFRSRQKADSAELDMRWNWETPFLLSPHNPDVFYAAGNRVVKSTQRGDNLYPISPDLSKKQMAKIDTSMNKTGGITLDATGAETYGTVVALAESYVRPGYLAAGTDDGNVWVTRSDGAAWEQIPASRFPGLAAGDVYVSRIEPSHFDSLSFYITFDNHRWNDFTPYVYVTNDYGKTFRSIVANLPKDHVGDFVHTVREDPYNRDLLFVGTSRAVYTSLDRGQSWQRLMSGMPTVPVYDLKIHPRDRELIAATHGRGIWIVDIAPLEQLAGDNGTKVVADAAYLFQPKTAYQYGQGLTMGASSNGEGHKVFAAPSPAYGAEISYRVGPGAVASAASQGSSDDGNNSAPNAGPAARGQGQQRGQRAPQAQLLVTNARGDTVRTLTGPATAGLHKVTWDFRGRAAAAAPLSPSQLRDSIVAARRMTFVFDSLEKAGTMPKPALDRIRQMVAGGDITAFFRGGGGGGGGGAGARGWNARPGEGAIVGAGAGAARGEGGESGAEPSPQDALNAFPGGFQELQQLLRPPGSVGGGRGGGGGFGGGRGQAPLVAAGDYLVTLTVGGKSYKQLLRVERLGGGDDAARVGGDDDDREP